MSKIKKKKNVVNYIVFALDTSGSMDRIREDVRRAYNSMLRTIRERSAEVGHTTYVSLLTFDDRVYTEYGLTHIDSVSELSKYPIRGMTALFDGVGECVSLLDDVKYIESDDVSFLVLVFTDGGENNSYRYSAQKIRNLISDRQKLGNWTFAFQMPPGQGSHFAAQFGIPTENIREWEATSQGVEQVEYTTNLALSNYIANRAMGFRSVSNFYNVTTDLSDLDKKQLKELDDISSRFKIYTVSKESDIKEFVEEKTKRPYIIGSAYYQLMKPEKVQSNKSVLIMEKGKKEIWGGEEARDLIGLPSDGVAKVQPGNHSNYDIFVESRSVNRKLPRGTKVLVDITKSKSSKPTWDHTVLTVNQ